MSSSCSTDCSTSTGSSGSGGRSYPGGGGKEDMTSWPLMRVVDGQSIQPSDLQSFRLPKVRIACVCCVYYYYAQCIHSLVHFLIIIESSPFFHTGHC